MCVFQIQRGRALQQSEKVGQTPTSKNHSRGEKRYGKEMEREGEEEKGRGGG